MLSFWHNRVLFIVSIDCYIIGWMKNLFLEEEIAVEMV